VAGTLAHGEQRQLEVGLALATQPKLLLLDEPMAGMGPEESERMVQLISGLRKDVSLLLVEHDMAAVFRLADRISVLVSGRVIASGSPQEIRTDAEVKRAYIGEDATRGVRSLKCLDWRLHTDRVRFCSAWIWPSKRARSRRCSDAMAWGRPRPSARFSG